TEADEASLGRVAILGKDIVDGLFDGADPIGSRIVVDRHTFTVVGVLERKGSLMGSSQDNLVLMPYSTFTTTFGSRRSPRILIAATSAEDVLKAEDELGRCLRRARKPPAAEPDDISTNRGVQFANRYNGLPGALYA